MANVKNQDNSTILFNRQIRAREVRLINEDGSNGGIHSFFRALGFAEEKDLDLILINPQSNPPVCKIGDAGKFKYDSQKQKKEQDKKNRENRVDLKEVQLRPGIDIHDLNIKINRIKEWITDGDKVKIVIRFRGREMSNQQVGHNLIKHILDVVPESKAENRSELQGNRLIVVLGKAK